MSAPGETLNQRYRLAGLLGQGRQSEVFLAIDEVRREQCAVRIYREGQDRGVAAELATLTSLSHPNVVRIHDAGRADGGPHSGRAFVVMDHLGGPDLASLAAVPDEDTRRRRWLLVARELCDGLCYLHGRGIIHGDISPANVRFDRAGDDGHPALLDFGLSFAVPSNGATLAAAGATGTLGYLAPEALVGERGALSDLFALGATLFAAWAGAPPFGTGLPSVSRMQDGLAPVLSMVRPGLPAPWDDLLARMLAPAPEDRPASAREVLREIIQLTLGAAAPVEIELEAPRPAGDPLSGIFVGRKPERECLAALIEGLARGQATVPVVAVSGTPGAGRRTLIRRVLRDARLAMLAGRSPDFDILEGVEPESQLAAAAPDSTADPSREAESRLSATLASWESRASHRPLIVVLPPTPESLVLAAWAAGTVPSGRLLVILPIVPVDGDPGRNPGANLWETIALPPLSDDEIATLASRAGGKAVSAQDARHVARASGGHAAIASHLIRRWLGSADVDSGRDRTFPAADANLDLEALLAASFAGLEPDVRRALAGLALVPSPGPETTGAAAIFEGGLQPALRRAQAAGWARPRADGTFELPGEAHERVILGAIADPDLVTIVGPALAALPAGDQRRARVLATLGRDGEAAASFVMAAHRDRVGGRPVRAVDSLGRAWELDAARVSSDDRLWLAGTLGFLGRYDEAVRLLDAPWLPTLPAIERSTVVIRRAWLLQRRGDLEAASNTLADGLAALLALSPMTPELAVATRKVRARLGRVMVSLGRPSEGLDVARPLLSGLAAPQEAETVDLARETTVLALAATGLLDQAGVMARQIEDAAAAGPGGDLARARGAYLAGLCQQWAGHVREASLDYRRALALLERTFDRHLLASTAFNLATVLAERGHYSEAFSEFERSIRELGRLQARGDLVLAVFNLGQLFLRTGDQGAAHRMSARLAAEATTPVERAYADWLRGDVLRCDRRGPAAQALYADVAERFATAGNHVLARTVRILRAETLAEFGRVDDAGRELKIASSEGSDDDAALAAARIALSHASVGLAEDAALARQIEAIASRAMAEDRLPVAWRAGILAARLLRRCNDPGWQAQAQRARQHFEEVTMLTPEKYRRPLAADPEARFLFDGPDSAGKEAAATIDALTRKAERADGRLRRLLRINKRLNSDLRLHRVLETVVDTVIDLLDAERGFLLLRDAKGELSVKVARNFDQKTLDGPEFQLSRSIALRAAEGGVAIVTVDATGDERFREAMSVSDLRLRSVLAVPLSVKGQVVGTIYVDHRLRQGAFDDDDVALVTDFAEQGAIAIENARLLAELRRRERQVESLNRRLEFDLSARSREITEMREEIKETREAATIRYDYRQIVGRTPRLMELFRLLDRVTDTALPVVIEGESGTGKELVARAIHFNGRRRERPFVSENCAAIPETLLESTLFGNVRGAFTGADRDTRGLFAVADGGTLFLDEVAEMSAAMQGKLLRVLQDGEFRRVGDERWQKVDVRIVAATNRDLGQLVEERKFRQDLFFRLSVVRINLPPLRERREDIPLLVDHFCRRAAEADGRSSAAKTVEPAALAKLVAHRWPGNVRELENEILRAVAFSGARITVADLSPRIADAEGEGGISGADADSLQIRPRVERLERSLIREALHQHSGNQTRAAESLGLSRFGLQKKLQRYRIAP